MSQSPDDKPWLTVSEETELPGDPACLLRRVCQNCGSVADTDPRRLVPSATPTCQPAERQNR